MKLYLTRHGQTDWNVQRKVCGQVEAHLTDLGRSQAAEMAEKVAETSVNLILTSPLERARDTARIVASRTGVLRGLGYGRKELPGEAGEPIVALPWW